MILSNSSACNQYSLYPLSRIFIFDIFVERAYTIWSLIKPHRSYYNLAKFILVTSFSVKIWKTAREWNCSMETRQQEKTITTIWNKKSNPNSNEPMTVVLVLVYSQKNTQSSRTIQSTRKYYNWNQELKRRRNHLTPSRHSCKWDISVARLN